MMARFGMLSIFECQNFFFNANILTKGVTVLITGASALDAVAARSLPSKCLFGIGCVCGAAGTVYTGLTFFNSTLGLPAFGVLAESAAGGFYWAGRRATELVV